MKPIWFIHRGGSVTGPFTSTDIERQIGAGSLGTDALIWARGSNEWAPISEWKQLEAKIQAAAKFASGRIWYCDSGTGQPAGPLTQAELVQYLKGFTRWESFTLWGTGLTRWLPLFEVPEVMDLIGISRREHPRAPLLGQAAITQVGSSTPAQVLQISTVSVGGLGLKQAGFLTSGDTVQIAIKSRDLPSMIHASGKVLYVSKSGDAGIRFDSLSAEVRSIIADHVRRFTSVEQNAA